MTGEQNQSITPAAVEKAFANWETAYRANPKGFYTEAETNAMAVASVSENRAIHFMALLRAVQT
jgi:hypothetical protein